ncbi:MAG TPA: hypothetical protein PLK77_11525 [Pyrinomonadaceae bacterium]|nr:hypothetical protein [Pyrinomonadaceae bacterium]
METYTSLSVTDAPIVVSPDSIEPDMDRSLPVFDAEELAFEIGAWLSGIRSFASTCQSTFAADSRSAVPDLRREFRILSLSLMHLSRLTIRMQNVGGDSMIDDLGLTRRQIDSFSAIIRDSVLLVDSHSRATNVSIGEWQAFVASLLRRLDSDPVDEKLRRYSFDGAYVTLPTNLRDLFEREDIDLSDRVDYLDVVPRVAAALRYLGIVGRMMRDDEPVKPALLILAAVHDQARGMIDHINLRLARNPNEEATLFNSLDSASYVASLELKKVFQQELRGIVGVLPPTSVFARTETAYSLLLDSFQQILLDLARTVDQKATLFDFFPRFQIKLDQSLILREHLWGILKAVKAAEESPVKEKVGHLKQELADFVTITIRFLHYKDEETFERFNEEVHAALDKKDLVPVLHRFGAYLETLFGQVCMRAVLAEHPFQHAD